MQTCRTKTNIFLLNGFVRKDISAMGLLMVSKMFNNRSITNQFYNQTASHPTKVMTM